MPELMKANRQVCDVDIRVKDGMKPFLFFDTANTTTAGLTGDSVYAMAKGSRRIAFQNPLEGSLTLSCQTYPFKLFSLLSDGTIDSEAVVAKHEIIKATTGGKLTLPANLENGTIFVYAKGDYGNEDELIAGSYSGTTWTPTDAGDITANTEYEVGYLIKKTSGIKKVAFSNKKLPKDYYITMTTLDKDDDGAFTPFVITAYKAAIQRNFELSFNSEGDPATIELTFELSEDKDGNFLDMVELTDETA